MEHTTQTGADPVMVGIFTLAVLLGLVFMLLLVFVDKYYDMKAERNQEREEHARTKDRLQRVQIQDGQSRLELEQLRKHLIMTDNAKFLKLVGPEPILLEPTVSELKALESVVVVVDGS